MVLIASARSSLGPPDMIAVCVTCCVTLGAAGAEAKNLEDQLNNLRELLLSRKQQVERYRQELDSKKARLRTARRDAKAVEGILRRTCVLFTCGLPFLTLHQTVITWQV